MKLKKNIALSESGFVFNPVTGDSYSANPVGKRVMELLQEEDSFDDILNILSEEYDVDRGRLEQDLDDFYALLRQLYLTENG